MRLLFAGLVFFCISFVFFPIKAWAAEEFATSYDVSYEVQKDASTQVTQKITLKNLTSLYYASNFTLTVGSTTITDISASDENGALETKTESKDNKSIINVQLNQQIAGVGKEQSFTLKFKSKDFTQVMGRVWEVDLPRLPEGANINSYNVVLSVPLSLGDPTSILPNPKSQSQSFDRLFFTFDKEQLQKNGVSVSFGLSQVFDFNIKYHLSNQALFPVVTSVVLPPDTLFQDVIINRLSPEPVNVTIDEDGNYLAWFQLPRRTEQDVVISGSAKLYMKPKDKKIIQLSDLSKKEYLKSDQYWEKDNPAVKNVLLEIFKEEVDRNTREKARLIYQYVVNTLKYDRGRLNKDGVERLGAVTVLNNPSSAACMEFTDLFIALSRAAGIPARELDGFGYSQNKDLRPLSLSADLLHAWPEYYDENYGWVMVDPTWENTSGGIDYFNKFDLNHLVLAIKGISSTKPYISDDIKVDLSNQDFIGKPQLKIILDLPSEIWAGFPVKAQIKILNQGNSTQEAANLLIKTDRIQLLDQASVTVGSIPPFGMATYPINLRTKNIWESFEDNIEVAVAGQKISTVIKVKSFFLFGLFSYFAISLVAIIVIIYGVVLGIHLYKKRSSLKIKDTVSSVN